MPKHPMSKVSVQTQRFIIKVVYDYDRWTGINTAQASNLLDMPHATGLRTFVELASIEPKWVTMMHDVRWFHPGTSKRDFLQKASPWLFSPVAREYRLVRDPAIANLPFGGMSAINYHASLPAPPFPTYAVTKEQERELGLKEGNGLAGWSRWDEPACVVHVMRYKLDSLEGTAIDPISAVLSLSDEELDDPLTERTVVGILEHVLAD